MKKTCNLLETTDDGQEVVATLVLDGDSLTATGNTALIENVLNTKNGPFTLKDQPDAWFDMLPVTYNGAGLRAERVVSKEDLSLEQILKLNKNHGKDGKFTSAPDNTVIPSKETQDAAIGDIKQYLKNFHDMRTPMGVKGETPEGFLLKHGQPSYMNENSFKGKRGEPKNCYGNSFRCASENSNFTYNEGYVHIGALPVEHAWLTDKDNNVIDPTMKAPEDGQIVKPVGYFGIPINHSYLINTALKTKVYGVLGGYHNPDLYTKDISPEVFKKKMDFWSILKNNPYHDAEGKFASREGASTADLGKTKSTEDVFKNPDGTWAKNRQVLHEKIIENILGDKTAPTNRAPQFTMLGGGFASGKSTLRDELHRSDNPNRAVVDTDAIRFQIPEFGVMKKTDPENGATRVQEEASYISKLAMKRAMEKGIDFDYDASASGKNAVPLVHTIQSKGYDTHLLFADVPETEAIARADRRANDPNNVLGYGRHVSQDLMHFSHVGSANNFQKFTQIPGLNDIRLYDTTQRTPKIVYTKTDGKEVIHDPVFYNYYREKGDSAMKSEDSKKSLLPEDHWKDIDPDAFAKDKDLAEFQDMVRDVPPVQAKPSFDSILHKK
jgi:predicted ABC-type ATPase